MRAINSRPPSGPAALRQLSRPFAFWLLRRVAASSPLSTGRRFRPL